MTVRARSSFFISATVDSARAALGALLEIPARHNRCMRSYTAAVRNDGGSVLEERRPGRIRVWSN